MSRHRAPTRRPSLLPLGVLAVAAVAVHRGVLVSHPGLVVGALMLTCAAITLAVLEDQP